MLFQLLYLPNCEISKEALHAICELYTNQCFSLEPCLVAVLRK
jgi:hypothetical protein